MVNQIKVHVGNRISGQYGPFYTLHKLDDEDPLMKDGQFIICNVGAEKMATVDVEYGNLREIVKKGTRCKWKLSDYDLVEWDEQLPLLEDEPEKIRIQHAAQGYDWLGTRKLYNDVFNLTQESRQVCPVCTELFKVSNMDLHHLIPKALGAHLVYDTNNMKYVCKDCHKKIHPFMEEKE